MSRSTNQARRSSARPRLESLEDRIVLANAIVVENQLTGNPISEWGITGVGDTALQGFATRISVDQGQTVDFKIDSTASDYRIDIYRMGYYAGLGARKVATIEPTSIRDQPDGIRDLTTGLLDCGNWSISASWAVPTTATSGVYFAKLVREDGTDGASHIPFIVRDDDGGSDLLFQTSDTTWQAYNEYGGTSLYRSDISTLPGRGYKVSYNRPFANLNGSNYFGAENQFFYSEYPMVQWLEANGYNVSYTTGVDTASRGSELTEHKAFLSVGHDEYWSGDQRANVESARNSGVHLAFFSGNEVFWKTRWEDSIDGNGTPYRTLVCYKETHADAKIDPSSQWTGTWEDPRFSPPADGGRPQNALTGQQFAINANFAGRVWVGEEEGKLRFWRNTDLDELQPGQAAGLTYGSVGFEADIDADNGFRPTGSFRVSEGTYDVSLLLQDYGSTYAPGTATHSATMFRSPCCAGCASSWTFGAGTIQWSWGLAGTASQPDIRMQQATVNVLADMDSQPETLQAGLVLSSASTDTTAPTLEVTSVLGLANAQVGGTVTLIGTAADVGGRVAGVEVSLDGGTSWRRATGRTNWKYVYSPQGTGTALLRVRAIDDSGNCGTAATVEVTVNADSSVGPGVYNVTTTDPLKDSVTIKWSTNEPATSRVDYGTSINNLNQSVSTTARVTEHSVTLTGLALNTTYMFRVSGADEFNNTTTAPHTSQSPSHFITPAFQVTTDAEIRNATVGSTLHIVPEGDGAVILKPTAITEFGGVSADAGWQGSILGPMGSVAISGGSVALRRAQFSATALYSPDSSMEFVATFNGPLQFGGFTQSAGVAPWAVFVTRDNGELVARTNNGAGGVIDTPLPEKYLRSARKFRVDWNASNAEYRIDGVLVATHNLSFTSQVRAMVGSQDATGPTGPAFVVDSIRVANYPSSGTFTSLVYDAGTVQRMGPMSWDADVPAGTALVMKVRTGNTPTPDASWTAYTTVAQSGADIGRLARYVQFSAEFTTTDVNQTPTLKSVRIGHGPDVTVDFSSASGSSGEGTATASIPVRLSAASTQAVTVDYAVTGGTAAAGTDFVLASGKVVFLPGETSKTISLTVLDEAVIEPDETIVVTLSRASYAGLGANTTYTHTITDNDPNSDGIIIDDDNPGFTTTGAWTHFNGVGAYGDLSYIETATGSTAEAKWTFAVSPGQYKVSATWLERPNRADNAPYTILDGTTQVSSVRVDQRTAPGDFTRDGIAWEDLDVVSITGNTLVVKLSANANASYVIADAVRIEWQGALPSGAQVRVQDGTTPLLPDGTLDLGNTVLGGAVTKTLTVKNNGVADLVLQEPITVPTGFSVASSFARTTLAPGETTTFAVRFDALTAGEHSGVVSFASNSTDNNPFRFTIKAKVSTFSIVDNGDADFSSTSGWLLDSRLGHGGDIHYVEAGSAAETSTWTFAVTPGRYRVSATWPVNPQWTNNALYTIADGTTPLSRARVNQSAAPGDFTESGTAWKDLDTVLVAGNTLRVRVSNDAHPGYAVADAVRVERLGDLPAGPQLQVHLDGVGTLTKGGTVNLGSTVHTAAVTKTFTVRNVGTQDVTLGSAITVPSGYTLVNGFAATTLAAGASTTFSVRLDATTVGTYTGEVSFTSNDADDSPYRFTLTGKVETAVIGDDADPGFTYKGLWTYFTELGHGTDLHFISTQSNGTAEAKWTFAVSPGQYKVAATWLERPNRATDAPYTILDGTTQVGFAAVNQQAVPDDFTASGSAWENLKTVVVTGTTLVVKLGNNAGASFVIADAVRIERIGDVPEGPQIEVDEGGVTVANGGSLNLGTTLVGGAVTKTFTVRNVGTQNVSLFTPITVPTGYTLTAGFGSTTLTPGQTTTFSVRLDAASAGTFTGDVSFTSNDGNDSPFRFTLTGKVEAAIIVDDGDDGFTTTGAWTSHTGDGRGNDLRFIETATHGSAEAKWTFDVTPGRYRVSATWLANTNRATNTPYTIFDGTTQVATPSINQRNTPDDFAAAGSNWEDLDTVAISGNTLVVKLGNNAGPTYVIADAVRIERVGDLLTGPHVQVRDGGNAVANGGTIDLGETLRGVAVTKTFTVRNVGTQDVTLGSAITVPSGYTLVNGFAATTLAAGASTTFSVRLDAATVGTYTGEVSFTSNDADDSPYRFTLTGKVGNVAFIDDGDAGFTTTGAWTSHTGNGRGNDLRFIETSVGGTAEAKWTFAVAPGRYRVSATWMERANRASDAPYTILDGTTTVGSASVDQRNAQSDLTDSGSNWKDLDTVTIEGTTLVVKLGNNAGASYVIADAIRVERVGDALTGPHVQVRDGSNAVSNGGTVNLGDTLRDVAVTKTFTVKNVGTQDVTLGSAITVPNGYTLVSGLGATTLAAGASTTFSVRLDATTVGTYTGEVSFTSNDADDSPYRFTLTGKVANVAIVDDGGTGFTTTGTWTSHTGDGHDADLRFIETASGGTAEAKWTFAVAPGRYRVSAAWLSNANRADNAPYTILDGTTSVGSASVDQRNAPADFTASGTKWEDLDTVTVAGNSLVVKLGNNANSTYVIADAIRVERVDIAAGPQVEVREGANAVSTGSTVHYGSTLRDVAVTKTFTVKNIGDQELTLPSAITVPSGYTLVSGLGATTLAAGASTTFSVRLDATTVGTYTGEVSFTSNDADDSPYKFTLTGKVSNVAYIDNANAGYTATSGWTSLVGSGRASDLQYLLSGTGSQVATWTFAVAPGTYKVSATWLQNTNRVTNAPYKVLDGATEVGSASVNQRNAPDDLTEDGTSWEKLADVTVVGNTLVVTLSDNADASQYVIADAIRVERI